MLMNIPAILPPELVKYMMEMGHGDYLVIADAHFPAHSCGKRVVRCDGIGGAEMLKAILLLMPLDTYVEKPVTLMETVKGDSQPQIWHDYSDILSSKNVEIGYLERFAYYEQTKNAYVVIQTGETAQYANVILTKGIVRQ